MVGGSHSGSKFSSVLGEQDQNIDNFYLTQSFQEQRQIDTFIRSTELIKIVKTAAENFLTNYQSSKRPEDCFNAIIIKLQIVYSDVFNHSLDLLHFVIEEPVQFNSAVKYCVFALLQDAIKKLSGSEDIDKINIDIDQVHVLTRFSGLPLQKDLCFQPHLNSYRTGLSEVIGVLSALTKPEKVVIQSVWYCSTGCKRNKIRAYLLDVPSCINCRQPMSEYPKLRYTQNSYLLRILPSESIESPRQLNKIFRAITVRVPEHVLDSQLILGDRYLITDSLREISNSQLEALLRFDSPPDTPIEPTIDPVILSGECIQQNLNGSKNDIDANSNTSILHQNREQFVSQLNSQIDFSIFNNYSPSIQWSLSPLNINASGNDLSTNVSSPLDTIEIPDSSERNDNIRHENISANKLNISIEKHGEIFITETDGSHIKENEFEEVDNIFKKIEYISNSEVSRMNKWPGSDSIPRKCQTQLALKSDLKNSHKVLVSSCPAQTGKHYYKELYTNNSTRLLPKPVFVDTIDDVQFNNINLTDISHRKDDNEMNFLSLNTNFNDKMVHMDNIFEEYNCCSSSGLVQTQCRAEENQTHSTDNSQPYTVPKNAINVNMPIDNTSIPFSIRQLHNIVKTKYSDFAFIYALSSQLCQDRVPMECFVTLKMALLLSLVSIGNNADRPPIPIVAMTNDTYMTDYLMTNIGQLGTRFLGPVDEIKSFSNINWIEADPTILARGGVYYVGDWTSLKIRRTETIFKNLECSSVAVEKSTLSFPLETAIWTHWRSFKYGAKERNMFNKFLKIFGIPIFVSDDNHEALIGYTLEQSSIRIFESTVDHLSVNEDDMRKFLVYVSQQNVDLSPEAALLLKNYFVASRSNKQDCLSKQSYTMLKQFAESFAKLSMHKVVSSDDAVAAIILCEHFIENIFSSSDNSPPHFGNFTFVGTVDKYLMQFKEWLHSYIEKFSNE